MNIANLTQAMAAGRELYTAGEAVTLTGGAGADWTPTLEPQTAGLWVGGAGSVKVDLVNGGTAVPLPVPAGSLLKVAVTKIYSAADGTSASNIVALY